MNGINGYDVRGRGDYASASIFLPAAGVVDLTSLYDFGSSGYYRSSVPYSDIYFAYELLFDSSNHATLSYGARDEGQPVRPVQGGE